MIIREIELTKDFKKDFANLPEDIKPLVIEILKKLEYNEIMEETIHSTLKRDLKGYISIHFHNNKYRLIYREHKNKLKLIALRIGQRSNGGDFYEKFKKYKELRKV